MSFEQKEKDAEHAQIPGVIRGLVGFMELSLLPADPVDNRGGNPKADFEANAENAYYRFVELSKTAEVPGLTESVRPRMAYANIWSGFLAVGRIIGLSVPAYIEYCEREAKEPQSDELVDILSRQKSFQKTALFLANMDNDVNRVWENALGVRENTYPYGLGGEIFGVNSFAIDAMPESDGPVLVINPEVEDLVYRDIDLIAATTGSKKVKRCQAIQHGSLAKVWQMQIQTAHSIGLFDIALGE